MSIAKIVLLAAGLVVAGCNDANLTSSGKKAVGAGQADKDKNKSKTQGDKPLGTEATDDASGTTGKTGGDGDDPKKVGALGDNGDGAKNGKLGENDDLVSTCKNQKLKTSVKLLTPTIQNGVPGNKVAYELQLLDCKGKPRPISAQFIHFDLDAEVDDPIANTYTVQVGGQTISGNLQIVEGVDLFGKAGPDFFHHKTDQAITLTETALTAILTIDLKGQLHGAFGDEPGGSFTCQSFLRFGDADPVAQPVAFVE